VEGNREPAGETGPGDHSADPEPHHALNSPAGEPDATEWPDPYDERSDPRDPPAEGDPDAPPHPQTGSRSTSEPHPDADIEAPDANPPERDNLDD
jgi:hypothetical protein